MTLSLKNSNKDFDFVGWVIKTSWLIYFRSVKFHYVKETHMMLVALVKIVVASQHKRQRKKIFLKICWEMKTPTRTWKLVHALHYANELLVRVRLAFQKTFANSETIKTGLGYDISIVWETHKLTRFQPGVKSFLT